MYDLADLAYLCRGQDGADEAVRGLVSEDVGCGVAATVEPVDQAALAICIITEVENVIFSSSLVYGK